MRIPFPLLGLVAALSPPGEDPKELGLVRWTEGFEPARARGKAEGKPLFVLFQEVPGCATCVEFGEAVLSAPLLVEAIETLFVPVAVHNNRSEGEDAEVLRRYGEPAWNNPVVRFLDADGRDLIPRAEGVYAPAAVARRMVEALRAAGLAVPAYLDLVAAEAGPLERATFAVHCFWEGEARLGGLSGVRRTRAGFLDGGEVVEVEFDPATLGEVLSSAARLEGASRVYAPTEAQARAARDLWGEARTRKDARRAEDAKPADRKYHLRRSGLRFVPMTATQATRVNAALAAGADPAAFLSPRQRDLAANVRAALERRPDLLDGLEPPEDDSRWRAYEAEVLRRLSA